MTQPDFEKSLRRFITGLAAERVPSIRRNTRIFEEGLIDSLKVLDLIAFIEQSLGIRVADDQVRLESFRSVGAISDAFWNRRERGTHA